MHAKVLCFSKKQLSLRLKDRGLEGSALKITHDLKAKRDYLEALAIPKKLLSKCKLISL